MVQINAVFVFLAGLALGVLPMRAEEEELPAGSPDRPVVESLPTLWIAGDSLVSNANPARGWGQELHTFFDLQKINIVNKAATGTLQQFLEGGRWRIIESGLKPGDFVLVSFSQTYRPTTGGNIWSGQVVPPRGNIRTPTFNGKPPSVQKDLAAEKKLAEENEFSEQIQSQGQFLRKIAQAARLKQCKVILCTPVPGLAGSGDRPSGLGSLAALPGSFTPVSPKWREVVESSAKSERTAFVDLSEIVGNAYTQLPPERIQSLHSVKGIVTNPEGALFNARLVVAGLRSIPAGPLEGFLNDAGRELPFLFGNRVRHTFTTNEGQTIDGVLVSAEGDSAEVIEFPTRRKVTVMTWRVTEADRKFIEEWKKGNPTIRLTHQVTKASPKTDGAAANDQRHYYVIEVKNASKDPTPKLTLYYRYKIDVSTDPGFLKGSDGRKNFGSLDIPPIPASGSVIVHTSAILLENQSIDSSGRVPIGNTSRDAIQYTTLKRRERLTGIAFDVYSGERLVNKYRANGFLENATLLRDGSGLRLDKP